MNSRLLLIAISILLPSCALSKTRANDCVQHVQSLREHSSLAQLRIDLEDVAPRNSDKWTPLSGYQSVKGIDVSCASGNLPNQEPSTFGAPNGTPASIPIRSGFSAGIPWILFVYLKRQGEMEGLGASIVTYKTSGSPQKSVEAAQLLSYEGAGIKRSSSLIHGEVIMCDQTFDSFRYNEKGDIVGELKTPKLSLCKTGKEKLTP